MGNPRSIVPGQSCLGTLVVASVAWGCGGAVHHGSAAGPDGGAPAESSTGASMSGLVEGGAAPEAGFTAEGGGVPMAPGCTTAPGAGAGAAEGGPSGAPVALANGQACPEALALDDSYVYWINSGCTLADAGAVLRTPIGGGSITTLASGQDFISGGGGIAVDATNVYWTTGAALMRMPKDGGPQVVLSSVMFANVIAVDPTNIYWIDRDSHVRGNGAIRRMPIVGGTPVTLDTVQEPYGLAVDCANVYFTTVSSVLNYDTPYTGAVLEMALAGGSVATLASSGGPVDLAVDSANAYWLGGTTGVQKTPLGGGASIQLSADNGGALKSYDHIAVFRSNVYWSDLDSVMAVPTGGGAAQTITSGQVAAEAVVANATGLYWAIDNGQGAVMWSHILP